MEDMMTTGHVFMAMSLDGFVARPDHKLDWLLKQKTDGEDHGYEDFAANMDGIIMGRNSFTTVLTFEKWPHEKPVIVLSRSLAQADVPPELQGKVRISALAPDALMASLAEEGWRRAYVDGGQIIQSFIQDGLIEDMTITLVPILIGEGCRLFGEIDKDIDLELIDTTSFPSGLIQTRYKVL